MNNICEGTQQYQCNAWGKTPYIRLQMLSRNAVADYGEMSDISNAIDLLIKEESSAITGQIIYLGGV